MVIWLKKRRREERKERAPQREKLLRLPEGGKEGVLTGGVGDGDTEVG